MYAVFTDLYNCEPLFSNGKRIDREQKVSNYAIVTLSVYMFLGSYRQTDRPHE